MKHFIITIACSCLCAMVQAQQLMPLKTFKSKEAKIRSNNLYDAKVDEQTSDIILTATVKKNMAEKLYFTNELVLKNRIDTTLDFDANNQKRKQIFKESSGVGVGYQNVSVDVLRTDVIEIASADAMSKTLGVNIINKSKVGLNGSPGFVIQKGDIQFVTNVMGDRVRTFTTFVPKEEIRLKSEEGKNLTYEFHTSIADGLQFEFKESDTYNKSKTTKLMSFVNQDADMLLIGKRKPIVKFGKAPSEADLLPVYYIYKINPKLMNFSEQTILKEPISRGIIYREKVELNDGIILVSAPLDVFGEKVPKDSNPRNYVFRLIGNDTKVKFEINHQVPSGFTQFTNVFELADKSIVLIAAINQKKKDKFFNQGTFSIPDDAFYTLTIKDGAVVSSSTFSATDFYADFYTPEGEKAGKRLYNPAYELTKNIGNYNLNDGGKITCWQITNNINGKSIYMGNLVLHIAANGKIESKYWVPAKSEFTPALDAEVIMKNNQEFYVLSHSVNDKGELEESSLVKINITQKSMSQRMIIGDEKHVLDQKFPFIQSSTNEMEFFGFDKSGKEIWIQKIIF